MAGTHAACVAVLVVASLPDGPASAWNGSWLAEVALTVFTALGFPLAALVPFGTDVVLNRSMCWLCAAVQWAAIWLLVGRTSARHWHPIVLVGIVLSVHALGLHVLARMVAKS